MIKITSKKTHEALVEENKLFANLSEIQAGQIESLRNIVTDQLIKLEKLQGENVALNREYARVQELLKVSESDFDKVSTQAIAFSELAKCNEQTIQRLTAENERLLQLSPTIKEMLDNLEKYKRIAINNRMMLDYKHYGNQLGRFAIYNQDDVYSEWFNKKVDEYE